jgi:hypothetical protein
MTLCGILSVLVATSCPLRAQGKGRNDIQKSCRNFVKQFYDWYVPQALPQELKKRSGPASDLALQYKSYVFSPELLRQLREDSEAQAKAKEIVGLDFDPFLNTQDPDKGYAIGKITYKDNRCEVEIYGTRSGQRSGQHVVPELTLKNGRWLFVNFHYGKDVGGGDSNLLRILKTLREERRKYPSSQ